MTENSTADLTMLDAERPVVVTGDEQLEDVLRGHASRVTIELVPIGPRLEARLDGRRIGELTALMSLRYAPTVDEVLRRGERPGCVGHVVRGKHGVEVELRLPAVNAAGGPPTEQLPVVAPRKRGRNRTPLWVGVGVVGLLVVIGVALGLTRGSATPAAAVAAPATARTTVPTTVPTIAPVVADPPTTTPARRSTAAKPSEVYYRNCGVALAEAAAPILKGEPGYRTGLDPDGDGVACPL